MRIIFAIDGSECSETALESAENFLCPIGTEMKVVTVIESDEPLPACDFVKEQEQAAAEKLVSDAVKDLSESHPLTEVTGEVLSGYPIDAIIKLSRNWLADLIVVGSHGKKGISRFWLGSVSRGLLLHAPCAVRIVRKGPHMRQADHPKRVLICLDQSEHSSHLIDHVTSLPWPSGTQFRCIHVIQELSKNLLINEDSQLVPNIADSYDQLVQQHIEWIQAAANKINLTFDDEVATSEVIIGDAREKILEISVSWPADIVMLGSHGKRSIERLIIGSVSETVALAAACSVEVTRVRALRKAGPYSFASV